MALSLEGLVIANADAQLFRVKRLTMTSDEIFELEQRRVFDRCWLYVGHESEVAEPGDFRRRKVGGRQLMFVRGSDGEVRALYNSCTHRGARVCKTGGIVIGKDALAGNQRDKQNEEAEALCQFHRQVNRQRAKR